MSPHLQVGRRAVVDDGGFGISAQDGQSHIPIHIRSNKIDIVDLGRINGTEKSNVFLSAIESQIPDRLMVAVENAAKILDTGGVVGAAGKIQFALEADVLIPESGVVSELVKVVHRLDTIGIFGGT